MKRHSKKHCLTAVACAAVMTAAMISNAGLAAFAEEATLNAAEQGGEAIVMYRGTSAMKSKALSVDMKKSVHVKNSYTFDTSADDDFQSYAAGSVLNKGFVVSLVQSDQLSTEELVQSLEQQPGVICAEPNFRIHAASDSNDPLAAYQWALNNTGQNGGTDGLDIHADVPELTADPNAGEQVIALVDTGVDYTHPDLADCIWENPLLDTGTLNGQHGYDFINMDDDPMDDNGHGSHCSGIMAAASDNGIGIAGTAKASQVKIMGLKILDQDGTGSGMEAVGAYNYIYQAQSSGVNVVAVNNSWGGEPEDGDSEILKTLIDLVGANGAVSICAAGNETQNNDEVLSIPTGCDSSYIISVAASDENDQLTGFSNWGPESVDLAAPGNNILSTVSYPVMNATFYSDAQKAELLHVYESFSDKTLTESDSLLDEADDTAIHYTVEANGSGTVSVTQDRSHFFGVAEGGAASLNFTITGASMGDSYTLYLPYTAQGGENAPYASAMVRTFAPENELPDDFFELIEQMDSISTCFISASTVDENGIYELENENVISSDYLLGTNSYWNGVFSEIGTCEEGAACAVAVQVNCGADGDYTVLLDELAVSDVNAPQDELLQNYDYYSGTSMAAPYVTGAMAAVAAANPDMDAEERMALLLGCTRKSDALSDMVKTGGVLDLSYLSAPNPILIDASLYPEDAALVVRGSQLTTAEITVNGEPAEFLSIDDKIAELDVSGMEKQQLDLAVTFGEDTTYYKSFYFAAGKPADEIYASEDMRISSSGSLLTYGDALYYCTTDGIIYCADTAMPDSWGLVTEGIPVEQINNGTGLEQYTDYTAFSAKYVTDGTLLYTVVHLDFGYMQKNVLASFDPEQCEWNAVSELPSAYSAYTDYAIGYAPDAGIYLMGGINSLTGELTADVLLYDMDKGEWNTSASMPAASWGGEVLTAGDRLILTLNRLEDGTVSSPWIFDGAGWRKADTEMPKIALLNDEEMQDYSMAAVAVYEDKLIYTGLPAIGVGDIFSYSLTENAFSDIAYTVYNSSSDHVFASTVSNGMLYIVYNGISGTETAKIVLGESALRGDVDMDEKITMDDAYQTLIYASHHALGENDYTFTTDETLEPIACQAADVDEDGDVDMTDAYYILVYSSYVSLGEEKDWSELIP